MAHRVIEVAGRSPDAVAVSGPDGSMTYAELAAWSARAAAGLVSSGVRPGDVVGTCLPRDHLVPAVMLAVWRAGAAYLPLDPDHPAERLAFLASDAGARLVLDRSAALRLSGSGPLPDVDPDGLAYVLYTSGSTGTPKAVEVTHANLAAGIAGVLAVPGLDTGDVLAAVAPFTFDVSAEEIWAPLCAGAKTVVVERECATDGYALAARLASCGATVVDLTPTALRMLVAAGWTGDPRLRVLTGGETLDPVLAGQILSRVCGLWNCYGPTETAISSTMHRVSDRDLDTVPIGRPMPGSGAMSWIRSAGWCRSAWSASCGSAGPGSPAAIVDGPS